MDTKEQRTAYASLFIVDDRDKQEFIERGHYYKRDVLMPTWYSPHRVDYVALLEDAKAKNVDMFEYLFGSNYQPKEGK